MTTIEFDNAKKLVNKLKNEPDNDTKLKLYGLFKQGTIGKCNTQKPGMLDIVARSKWNAWNELKKMSQEEARKAYISLVSKLYAAENSNIDNPNKNVSKFTYILASIEYNHVFKIVFNRPTKKNAFLDKMYMEIISALKEAETNPEIKFCVFTGSGDFFSSGNDLSNYLKETKEPEKAIKQGCKMVEDYVNAFINFPKPLIALVNGPAIGISFTILGLFDLVFSSERAFFYAPFTRSALVPEGCSSFTFPKLMGHAKASEILLFNRKLNAQEAFERNLVNSVFPHDQMEELFKKKIEEFSNLNCHSLIESKKCLRTQCREQLMKVNHDEMRMLEKRLMSGDFMESVMSFMTKKPKL